MRQDDVEPTVGIAPDGVEPPSSPIIPSPTTGGGRRRPTNREAIDAEVRHRIGRNLKLLYADILSEPLPERFETLLANLVTRRETS